MRACAIQGCRLDGRNVLGVRCRKPSTRALWAPNAGVGLCDEHARTGVLVELSIHLEPLSSGVTVECAGTSRSIPFSEAISD